MESDFQQLPSNIQQAILKTLERINREVTNKTEEKIAPTLQVLGETFERKVAFKLITLEDGQKTYVFDYLAW